MKKQLERQTVLDSGELARQPMRIVRKGAVISRRNLLAGTGAALVTGLHAPGALARSARAALTRDFTHLGPDVGATLTQIARDIFPHDRLADKYYVAAIRPYEDGAAKDPALKSLIRNGIENLDQTAQARFKMAYADVPAEMDRVALLMEISESPFFQKVRGDLVTSLYDNKDVWPFFGYEGSSWEKGGYLNRGFDDIDWL